MAKRISRNWGLLFQDQMASHTCCLHVLNLKVGGDRDYEATLFSIPFTAALPWWFPLKPAHNVQILRDYAANTISGISSSVSLFFTPSEAPTYLPLTGHLFQFHYLPPHAVVKNLPSAH